MTERQRAAETKREPDQSPRERDHERFDENLVYARDTGRSFNEEQLAYVERMLATGFPEFRLALLQILQAPGRRLILPEREIAADPEAGDRTSGFRRGSPLSLLVSRVLEMGLTRDSGTAMS